MSSDWLLHFLCYAYSSFRLLDEASIGNIKIAKTDIVQFPHHMYLHKSILQVKNKELLQVRQKWTFNSSFILIRYLQGKTRVPVFCGVFVQRKFL